MMNEFGLALVWLAIQVTALCAIAIPFYLLTRRSSPQSGAMTALCSLLLVTLVTAAAFSPWPRWSFIGKKLNEADASASMSIADADESSAPVRLNSAASKPSGGWASIEFASQVWTEMAHGAVPSVQQPDAVSEAPTRTDLSWTGWVAVAFLVATAAALLRLIAGLVLIGRYRRGSRTIGAGRATEMLDVICAESCCRRRIELRQSDVVVSAATIGWKRPLILLPDDYHTWTESELRGVLAHEVAHIKAHDFPCWLMAQAGVLLHFYHPLVHWLAGRMRLEQELAADAAAAQFSGGPRTYLRTLAELALRQSDRPIAWPARTFLPVKGTLMRRLEMLRDTNVSRSATSGWTRALVMTSLLAVGIGLAGIRPPQATAIAAEPVTKTVASVTPSAIPADKCDVSLVPANSPLIMGVRPASLAAQPAVAPLVKLASEELAEMELSLSDFNQVLMIAVPEENIPMGRDPVFVLHMASAAAAQKFIKARIGAGNAQTTEQVGRYSLQSAGRRNGVVLLDGNVILNGYPPALKAIIQQIGTAKNVTARETMLARYGADDGFMILDVAAIRPDLERDLQRTPGNPIASLMGGFAPLWKDSQYLIAGVNTGDGGRLEITSLCNDAAGAKRVATTARSMLPIISNLLASAQAQFDGRGADSAPPGAAEAITIGLAFVAAAEVSETETSASLTVPMDASAGGLPQMISMLMPAITSARSAARRAQSMNNLKQIGLAYHNYFDAYRHFPSTSMTAPGSQFKHSWRVAILPFIEQIELYQQYKLDEPWDSENNLKVLARMPANYRHPSQAYNTTTTCYVVIDGADTATGDGTSPISIFDIIDGTSNTLLVAEALTEIPWTKPEDVENTDRLGGLTDGGFNAVFADGYVRFLSGSIDPATLKAIVTRNGKEVVDLE